MPCFFSSAAGVSECINPLGALKSSRKEKSLKKETKVCLYKGVVDPTLLFGYFIDIGPATEQYRTCLR